MHSVPCHLRRSAAVVAVVVGSFGWLAGWLAGGVAGWVAGSAVGLVARPAHAEETPSSYGAPAKVDTPILRLPLMKAATKIDGVMEKGEWDDSSALSAFFYDYGQGDFRFMAAPQTQVEVYGGFGFNFPTLTHDFGVAGAVVNV